MSDAPAEGSKDSRPPPGRSWSDLGPRFASAAVLIPVAAAAVVLGGYYFAAVIGIVFAGTYREWEHMVTLKPVTPVGIGLMALVGLAALVYPAAGLPGLAVAIALAVAVAVAAGGEAAAWRVGGLVFFGFVLAAMLLLRGTDQQQGIYACVYVATVIWITDTAAFFTGRQVGGEKLAPGISPGKTWSGAVGGLAIATLVGMALWLTFTASPWWIGLLLSAGLSVTGQLGDLAESALKRRFRIKDSGDIIPGHGGLMDRLDSITFGALAAAMVGLLHGGLADAAAGLLQW